MFRDVASVVHVWCASGNSRLQLTISLPFRCVFVPSIKHVFVENSASPSRVGQRASIKAWSHVLWQVRELRPDTRKEYGTRSNCSWTTWSGICSCCGLESVRCRERVHSFWMIWRLRNGNNYLARLDIMRSVCGMVVGHYRSIRRFNKNPFMPFSRWVVVVHFVSFDVIVWSPSAPRVGMLYMFSIWCCSFHWFLFIFAQRNACVCWKVSAFVVHVVFLLSCRKNCDVGFFFGLMKFCDVIAGAFGVSGCIFMQTVLRDATFVVQLWRAIEHNRLQSMISFVTSLFRFVVFQTYVCGEHGKFAAWDNEALIEAWLHVLWQVCLLRPDTRK